MFAIIASTFTSSTRDEDEVLAHILDSILQLNLFKLIEHEKKIEKKLEFRKFIFSQKFVCFAPNELSQSIKTYRSLFLLKLIKNIKNKIFLSTLRKISSSDVKYIISSDFGSPVLNFSFKQATNIHIY